MKNLTLTIFVVSFVSLVFAGCARTTEVNSNLPAESNINKSSAPNDTTKSDINQKGDSEEKEEFDLLGRWKHVSSRVSSTTNPVFIRDNDIYFTFEKKGKGTYTKTLKGMPEQPSNSTSFKWKWKDDKTLIMDKIRDEVIEAEIIDKGPRHLELKMKDTLGIRFLLQKPIKE